MHPLSAAALAILLTSCGVSRVDLPYAAQHPVTAEVQVGGVMVTAVEDARPDAGSVKLGEIRTSLGLKQGELDTAAPVDVEVGRAVTQGLAARGMLASPGPPARYDLKVRVLDLEARRDRAAEAVADLLFVLTEHETRQQVWMDRARVYDIDASEVSLDLGPVIIAPAQSLTSLTSRTLSLAIDQLLDRPNFRAILRRSVTDRSAVEGTTDFFGMPG